MKHYVVIPASLCNHREVKLSKGKTICVKCGRIRVISNHAHFFYYQNDVHYFTKTLKEPQSNENLP